MKEAAAAAAAAAEMAVAATAVAATAAAAAVGKGKRVWNNPRTSPLGSDILLRRMGVVGNERLSSVDHH